MALSQITCLMCGSSKSEREYLASGSVLYGNEKKIPICKKCLEVRFRRLYELYDKDGFLATKHLCMNFDIYFDEETFYKAKEENESIKGFITTYIRMINRNKSTFHMTSMDNSFKLKEAENVNIEEKMKDFNVTEEMFVRWGRSYTREEIQFLEDKFNELKKDYPSERREEIELIKDLSVIELCIKKAIDKGDSNTHIKYMNLKSDKMDKLNVIPSKRKQYGEDKDLVYGNLIKRIENEEPIPDSTLEFNDVDHIQYWLDRYFRNPIRKVMGMIPAKYTQEDEVYDYENKK